MAKMTTRGGFRWAWGLAAGFALIAGGARAGDWPAWRGPSQNGVSYEKGLPASTEDLLWRAPYGGRSTPVVLGGRVFGINLAGQGVMEQDRVFALDLATGKPVWEHRFNVFHTDVPNSRVGWASLVADPETGNVYAHGVEGMFLCFDRDGKVLWSRSLTELYGRISGYGGRTHTPIIDEDRVIISFLNSSFGAQAVGAHRYLAIDKRTGDVRWWSTPGGKPEDTTYSVPVAAVVDGQRLLIAANADGAVYAMRSRTGEKVWGFRLSQRGINSAVVVDGHRVYAMHCDENHDSTAMGRVVCIDARGRGDVTKTHELWRRDGIEAGYTSPLLHGGRLYVVSNSGVLYCFDAAGGNEIWRHTVGRIGKGSPVWADGKIYVTTAEGRFTILEDAGSEARKLDGSVIRLPGSGPVEAFGSPAVADGRVLFFTSREMICLGNKDAKAQTALVPAMAAEAPPDPNTSPAALQVRPAEVLIGPSETVPFQVVAFDAQGRPLGPVTAQWSYGGPGGAVTGEGKFHAHAGHKGSIGEVTARAGAAAASARVRIVPELPIGEDFESYQEGQLPGWWVGVSKAKYAVQSAGGSKVLTKLADDRGPIFNRSHVFVTPPLRPGYTVQADVMGFGQGNRRGDVGLINDRYTLEMIGGAQRLRVVSWVPGPRFEKRIDFPWTADRWYTMKFHVALDGAKARLQAKVWPRDQAEPHAWTIETFDPQPNLEGSAGLYANSMAPVCFDNVRMYRGADPWDGLRAAAGARPVSRDARIAK
jgi:outer membrane protein assembly factor BamB